MQPVRESQTSCLLVACLQRRDCAKCGGFAYTGVALGTVGSYVLRDCLGARSDPAHVRSKSMSLFAGGPRMDLDENNSQSVDI